ncbi:4-hydroxy-3-methylbut-2-enyl diphosphate reductase [Geodermatophilus sp. SYSU D00758]
MTARPVVATPLRSERAALTGAVPGVPVQRTGRGPRRSAAWVRDRAAGPVLVAGVAGALDARLRPGDLVVAGEVLGPDGSALPCPSAPLLAGALRRRGLTVHVGAVATATSVVTGRTRTALAAGGALAVDTESALLAAAGDPRAVVRAVVDTPADPLLHPGTPGRGVRALRSLRAAGPALAEWAAALGPRAVVLASPRAFCAGVERAIDTVARALDAADGAPVHVRRQIVHNAHVVRSLEERGAVFVEELDEVPRGARVVLSAHGVAPEVHAQAAERDLAVVDATCPLVAKVHAEVRRYTRRGDTVLLIGHAGHEEVVGTVGEAPGAVRVVGDVDAARTVAVPDPQRVAYVMQTTLAVDEAERIAAVLRERFPALQAPRRDDICYATTNRQQAVRAVAAASDLVLVVGSGNSSNSRRLVEVAERAGCPAALVEDAGRVDLRRLAGARRVGITAGASAPPSLVDELVAGLSGLGPVTVREEHVVDEDVRFALPQEVS